MGCGDPGSAQVGAGIVPLRRPDDLRHTYASFALRAGISIFDFSRFMGASPAMIDRLHRELSVLATVWCVRR
jgi:integrase